MAVRSKRPCRRCSTLTDNKSGLCDQHQATVVEERKTYDKQRGTAHSRGYGSRWRKARTSYLRSHPLCAECERRGRLTVAKVVDHIIPHLGDKNRFWDSNNWQALCESCHSRKTAAEDGGFGNRSI